MPMEVWGHAMVTSPTDKGVIVMGGCTALHEYSKEMFELSASMEWTRLQTLKIGHRVPLAIPIPNQLVFEKSTFKFSPYSPLMLSTEVDLKQIRGAKLVSDLWQPLSTSLYVLIGGILLALLFNVVF